MTIEEKILQLRVGIVVILAAVIAGTLIFLFGDGWTPTYALRLRPRMAPGVTRNTPVHKNGILIGRVHRVETTDRGVDLVLRINRGEKIYADEIAQIGMSSFLGDAVIEILPGTSEARGPLLVDGSEITQIRVKPNPIEVVDVVIDLKERVAEAVDSVRRAGDTVDRAGQGIAKITDELQGAMDDEASDLKQIMRNMRTLSENANEAVVSFNRVLGRFDEVFADEEWTAQLKESLKGLPSFFDEAKQTLASTRDAIDQFKSVGQRADVNLANIEEFTKSLGADGPAIIEKLRGGLDGLDTLVENVEALSATLRNGEGTIGRLIQDPSLYENLNATVANAREISVKLKPLVNDLRVFADRIARDPGQLGVRGALQARPLGSGYKGSVYSAAPLQW